MQVSELVEATSVPLATVKYYLREGLLPPGRRVTARSSDYGPEHVRRLTLLRLLREVGSIQVSRLRELVDAVEDTALSVHQMFARASDAIAAGPARADEADDPTSPDRDVVRAALADMGWDRVRSDATDLANLRRVVTQLQETGLFGEIGESALLFYGRHADEIARAEIAALPQDPDRAAQLERMVIGTVAFGEILTILRRLAQEQHSASRFDTD